MMQPSARAERLLLAAGTLIPLAIAATIAVLGANQKVFLALQQASRIVPASIFESFWESATYVGDGLAAVAIAALFLRHRNDVSLAIVTAAIPLVGAFTHILRPLFPVDRPPHVLVDRGITILGPALQFGSFPSGHSATAGALAGVICLAFPNAAVRVAAVLAAMIVAMSRVAVGVHWPTDITVGFAGGWLCAWIAWSIVGRRPWASAPWMRVGTCVVLAGCAIALVFHPMGLPHAILLRMVLAVLAFATAIAALVQLWNARGQRPDSTVLTPRS